MYELEKIEYKGMTIRICQEEDADEPDWGGDEVFLVAVNKGYRFGRRYQGNPENHMKWGEGKWGEYGEAVPSPPPPGEESEAYSLYEEWCDSYDQAYQVFPFRCGNAHGPGSFCIWLMELDDWGRKEPDGWIYVQHPGTPLERLANLEHDEAQVLEVIIDNYQNWANGNVYFYQVEDSDGEFLDSCGGYYNDKWAVEAAKEAVDTLSGQMRSLLFLLLYADQQWAEVCVDVPLRVGASEAASWSLKEGLFGQDRQPVAALLRTSAAWAQPEEKG